MNYLWLFAKVSIIYIVLIVILRVLGKREVGQLSIFDLVILLIIADIASIGVDNDEFFLASLFCLFILAVLQKLLSVVLIKCVTLRNICDGNPTILVYNGIINVKNMKKELYTIDDLVSQMRIEHIMDINEIKLAVLETSGTLSVFKKESHDSIIMPVIISGKFIKENLDCISLKEDDVDRCLIKHKLNLKHMIYASYEDGFLTYYYKENNRVKEIKASKLKID